jgi:hypothetical protein
MKILKRRLNRLEARLLDKSGCRRYSAEWFSYWHQQADRLWDGQGGVPRIPIEFFDAILAEDDQALASARPECSVNDPDERSEAMLGGGGQHVPDCKPTGREACRVEGEQCR